MGNRNIDLHALKTAIADRFSEIRAVAEDGTTSKVVLDDKYRAAGDEVDKQIQRVLVGLERLNAAENLEDYNAIGNRIISIVEHDLGGALVALAKHYIVAVRKTSNLA